MEYTVVGMYPDMLRGELGDIDPDDGTYVEWIEAGSPEQAVLKVQTLDPERAEAVVVAVFEGQHIDRLFNKRGERTG